MFFYRYAPDEPQHFCADPSGSGHEDMADITRGAAARDNDQLDADAARQARRLVIAGNRAWTAAGTVRYRWLKTLFAWKTAPPQIIRFVAAQLLSMPVPLSSGLAHAPRLPLMAELTARDSGHLGDACATMATGRLALLLLAPIVIAYENAMTGSDASKATWRTDRFQHVPARKLETTSRSWSASGTPCPASSRPSPTGIPGPARTSRTRPLTRRPATTPLSCWLRS